MSEIKEEIVIDEAVTKELTEKTAEAVKASLVLPTADEIAEKMIEKTEAIKMKNIHDDSEKRNLAKGLDTLPKEVRFAKAVMAHKNNDGATINEYNAYVNKAWGEISKANYQNVTTNADGGALVPDPEFVAEIERLTNDYGTVARLATIRNTDRDSVTLLSGTNEISFVSAAEATAKNATKLTYDYKTVSLNKYIATLVMTSEIIEDSAINIWQDATTEVARARAKLFDQLVFTDATYGLLTPAIGDAYKTQAVGSALSNFDADDCMNATYKVVSSVRRNGKFFMHPSVWNVLRQQKASTSGTYLFGSPNDSVTPTLDGYAVELVDAMPSAGEVGSNTAFAVFGDLSRIKIHNKRLLETKIFDSGVVKDAGGTDINLITQDSWALRATLRAVPQTRFDGAFVILGTGNVS